MYIAIISVAPPYRGGISQHTSILAQKLSQKHPIKTVVNKIVYKTGKPRNIIYKEALKIKKLIITKNSTII